MNMYYELIIRNIFLTCQEVSLSMYVKPSLYREVPVWALTLSMFFISPLFTPAWADEESVDARHGSVSGDTGPGAAGGITMILQGSDQKRTDAEFTASTDLVFTIPAGRGKWSVYVEGSTTPQNDGVLTRLGEVNADGGSALDERGDGRFQVSEWHYWWPVGEGHAVAGLLDATGYIDSSAVANDETEQFLGTSFVNNPTIAFPSYTLGGVWRQDAHAASYTVVLTSSHGLGDHPDVSYAQALDLNGEGKGVFAALEVHTHLGEYELRTGLWANTAEQAALDGGSDSVNPYGVFAVTDFSVGQTQLNARLGWANPQASVMERFIALAATRRIAGISVGAGVAWGGASNDLANAKDLLHAEIYSRYTLNKLLSFSPHVQWIKNSGLKDTDANLVYGLRMQYSFAAP